MTKATRRFNLDVEIDESYTPEEKRQLMESVERTRRAVEHFTNGAASDIFEGLRVKIGEGIVEGGAKALAEKNRILLSGKKLLLNIEAMRQVSGAYSDDELTGFPDTKREGGALEYTLAHEMGHILDEQTLAGRAYHRVAAGESPTKYGREFDKWNSDNKDHEAFAEGFAHQVWGMPVSDRMETVVRDTIAARLREVTKKS